MDNPSQPGSPSYDAEVRFGVVMYGGVSLAIYINGVANELNELARATPRPDAAALPPELTGTRAVYRKLSRLVNDPPLVQRYAAFLDSEPGRGSDPLASVAPDAVHTRFVVDVIAGTSAGGINGVFLAKALANDEAFAPLADLWVREGDIGGLLNDSQSYADPDMHGLTDTSAQPHSLLNSDRMYRKLRKAMSTMSGAARAQGAALPSPFVDELDLFVTTTDVEGSLVTLRLFDKLVHEKRHRQVFHFRYADDGRNVVANDLQPSNEPFLAFAARCTSSFPFAFEPMTLAVLPRLDPALKPESLRTWNGFFTGLPPAELAGMQHLGRAFGDGGYLDNKPFTHAVGALSSRAAGVPVERKLVYVEPAPEHPEREASTSPEPPDALSNSLAALTAIPRYETIREDLEAVLKRNRRIERIDRIVRLGEHDLDAEQGDPMARVMADSKGQIPDWRKLTMKAMRAYYGDAFLPYSRLRHYTVTDDLADRLAVLWALESGSDQVYALRALVRAWREAHYNESTGAPEGAATLNAFLADFDLQYRVRRTAFLLRKTDQLIRMLARRRRGPLQGPSEADLALARRLGRRAGFHVVEPEPPEIGPPSPFPPMAGEAELLLALDALHRLKRDFAAAHTTLRNANPAPQDAADVAARRTTHRPELLAVLDLMLLREGREPPLLRTVSGAHIPVRFPDELLKLPSATRSLQESVFLRARALMKLAGSEQRTLLQDALEGDIHHIGVHFLTLFDGLAGQPPSGGALVWQRLGQPKLETTATGTREEKRMVYVKTGDETGVPELDTVPARQMRRFLGEYYLRFDSYDQMSFPLYYDTDSGEPATVEVVRISPEDAPSLIDENNERRRKLAGTALANFGAFLQHHWRTNDIMWGRLDGAERLIAALLPGADGPTALVRRTLTHEAHCSILREALLPSGRQQLSTLLCDAIAEVERGARPEPSSTREAIVAALPERLRPAKVVDRREALTAALLARLAPGSPAARRRLEQVVGGLLEDEALYDWVKNARDVDRTPDPQPMLDNASRAITITGRLLETLVRERGAEQPALRWVARLGLAAQGLLAVSLPGSLKGRLWSHVMKVLYAFELAALALGFVLASEPVRTAALTALGVTGSLHLASMLLGDVLNSKRRWRVKGAWIFGVLLVLLAALGVLALARVGWRALVGLD